MKMRIGFKNVLSCCHENEKLLRDTQRFAYLKFIVLFLLIFLIGTTFINLLSPLANFLVQNGLERRLS